MPYTKLYRMPLRKFHYFAVFVSLHQATLLHAHRSYNDLLSPLPRVGCETFLTKAQNSLAISNASSTLLFRLAMNCDNSHLPSRLCSTARHTSSKPCSYFLAIISWVTSYTLKPLCWQDFLGLDAFFSLAFLFLLANARSVWGGEDKSGCCSECRHSLSCFVTYLYAL